MTHFPDPEQTWTLGELVVEIARQLERIGTSVSDARVSDAPDARVVRYYQGLGLVDRPLRYEGRRAIYGWRHLVQALATKILQSQGYSLSQVQDAFQNQSFEALENAVRQAMGAPSSSATTPPEPAAPVELRAFALAPGVQLTLDPRLVPDPDGLARQFATLVKGALS